MQRLSIPLILLVTACSSPQTLSVDAPTAPPIDAPGGPTLAVTASPTTGVPGDPITITLSVTNFAIIDPRSSPPVKPGEGHFHYYIDDAADYTAGWTNPFTYRPSTALGPGPHTLRFVLATSAHDEVAPLVEATTTITIQ